MDTLLASMKLASSINTKKSGVHYNHKGLYPLSFKEIAIFDGLEQREAELLRRITSLLFISKGVDLSPGIKKTCDNRYEKWISYKGHMILLGGNNGFSENISQSIKAICEVETKKEHFKNFTL